MFNFICFNSIHKWAFICYLSGFGNLLWYMYYNQIHAGICRTLFHLKNMLYFSINMKEMHFGPFLIGGLWHNFLCIPSTLLFFILFCLYFRTYTGFCYAVRFAANLGAGNVWACSLSLLGCSFLSIHMLPGPAMVSICQYDCV